MPNLDTILLVDDREEDVMLMRRAFVQARVLNPVQVARSGEDALAYLSGLGEFGNRAEFPLPGLVLLDIKMLGMDGFEVLRWIRKVSLYPSLRVVMLTSSERIRDVKTAYELGANSFLVKPLDFERFVEISEALSGYWLWSHHAPDPPDAPEAKLMSDTEFIRRTLKLAP
jgi:CheY-like chemotaxis protein